MVSFAADVCGWLELGVGRHGCGAPHWARGGAWAGRRAGAQPITRPGQLPSGIGGGRRLVARAGVPPHRPIGAFVSSGPSFLRETTTAKSSLAIANQPQQPADAGSQRQQCTILVHRSQKLDCWIGNWDVFSKTRPQPSKTRADRGLEMEGRGRAPSPAPVSNSLSNSL